VVTAVIVAVQVVSTVAPATEVVLEDSTLDPVIEAALVAREVLTSPNLTMAANTSQTTQGLSS
jgi:hypothetical protein